MSARALALASLVLLGAACVRPLAKAPASFTLAEVGAPLVPPPAAAPEPASGPVVKLRPADLSFVTTVQGRRVVVLDAAVSDDARSGPPEVEAGSTQPMELRAPLDPTKLPEVDRLGGRVFALYAGAKKLCEVRVGEPRLVGALFEPGMDWAGSPQRTPPASALEIADEAWSMASKWLVADVTLDASCEGATWARLASEPAPEIVASDASPPPKVTARVWDAVATLDAVASAQPGYDQLDEGSGLGAPGPWLTSSLTARVERAYSFRGSSYVAVGASVGETCGFSAAVFAVYRVDRGRTEIVSLKSHVPGEGLLVDLNHDGHLEDLSGVEGSGTPQVEPFVDDEGTFTSLEIASPGCPC